MKVLVISHPSFSTQNNMGKTLITLLASFEKAELCQLYIQPMLPDADMCGSYYRITDTDALRSIVKRKSSGVGEPVTYTKSDTRPASRDAHAGMKRKVYAFGQKRTCGIYVARNTLWKLSRWYSETLKQWIRENDPDVIFLAPGDYRFFYDIAYTISCDFDIPMIMYCCDDYYINRQNPRALMSKLVHRNLMKSVGKCVSRSVGIITICEEMAEAYHGLFGKPTFAVYTGSSTAGDMDPDGCGIVYLGNLSLRRYKSLVDIGRALKQISAKTGENLRLDVYSAETSAEILREMTEDNGIVFHGAVSSQEVNRIISESRLAVHTESFDPADISRVRYSVSTKIADLLASGRCVFAYGPEAVASVKYLLENDAACVVSDRANLAEELESILNDREKRVRYIANAKALAKKNHDGALVSEKVAQIIRSAL